MKNVCTCFFTCFQYANTKLLSVFFCLFVCLFVYQATLHIIDLITLVIMNSFPLGLAHH